MAKAQKPVDAVQEQPADQPATETVVDQATVDAAKAEADAAVESQLQREIAEEAERKAELDKAVAEATERSRVETEARIVREAELAAVKAAEDARKAAGPWFAVSLNDGTGRREEVAARDASEAWAIFCTHQAICPGPWCDPPARPRGTVELIK